MTFIRESCIITDFSSFTKKYRERIKRLDIYLCHFLELKDPLHIPNLRGLIVNLANHDAMLSPWEHPQSWTIQTLQAMAPAIPTTRALIHCLPVWSCAGATAGRMCR